MRRLNRVRVRGYYAETRYASARNKGTSVTAECLNLRNARRNKEPRVECIQYRASAAYT